MRKGIVLAGIILAAIGALVVLAGYAVNATPQSATISSPNVLTVSVNSIGSTSLTANWGGGTANTTMYLVADTSASSFSCPPAADVAKGTGASGTLSASLSPGTTYGLYACNGATQATVNVSTSETGLSILMLLGVLLVIVGIIIAAVGARARPKVRAAPAPASLGPSEPAAMTSETESAATEPAPAPAPASMATDGTRPPRICPSCGTSNDVWLTNCRKCHRPLGTTG
jgi:uncharacterized membrane protein/ribosomal protein L40E